MRARELHGLLSSAVLLQCLCGVDWCVCFVCGQLWVRCDGVHTGSDAGTDAGTDATAECADVCANSCVNSLTNHDADRRTYSCANQ